MSDELIRINYGRMVPPAFRWFWTGLMFFLIIVCFQNLPELPAVFSGIVLSLAVFPVWSAYYLLELDTQNRTVGEHTWIMGRKTGQKTTYKEIEKVFVNSSLAGQLMHGQSGHVYQNKWREYRAFVKFDDGRKIFLISDRDLDVLENRLKPILKKLNCPLQVNV